MPLADDSADVIVCALALVHVLRLQPVMAEFARVLRPGGDLVISDIHHELVTRGWVITARGPAGEPCIAATYRHQLGDYLRAALSVGLQVKSALQVKRCEEPRASRLGGPPPEPATEIGDWRDWPWSLTDYLPSAARAAGGRRHWSSGTSGCPAAESARGGPLPVRRSPVRCPLVRRPLVRCPPVRRRPVAARVSPDIFSVPGCRPSQTGCAIGASLAGAA
jgi:SAM-dependent methyltransferase